jgi:ribosomal protein S7
MIIPHSHGRFAKKRFGRKNVCIVERLINKLMRSGQGSRKVAGRYIRGRGATGKKLLAMKIVEKAFEIVEKRTGKNPIQVLVLQNQENQTQHNNQAPFQSWDQVQEVLFYLPKAWLSPPFILFFI